MNGNRENLDKKIQSENITIDKNKMLEALTAFYVDHSITKNAFNWFVEKFNASGTPTLEADKKQIEDARQYFIYRTIYRHYYGKPGLSKFLDHLYNITNGILRKYGNSEETLEFKNFIQGKSKEIEMHEGNEININNFNYYLNQADILKETLSELSSMKEKETDPELLIAIQNAIEETNRQKDINDKIIDTYNECKEAKKHYDECVSNNNLAQAEEFYNKFNSLKSQLPPILQKAIGNLEKTKTKDIVKTNPDEPTPTPEKTEETPKKEDAGADFTRSPFSTKSRPSAEQIDELIKQTQSDIDRYNREIEELNKRFIEIKSNMNNLEDENLLSALEEIKKLNQEVNKKKRSIADAEKIIVYLNEEKKKIAPPAEKKTDNKELDDINSQLAQIETERRRLIDEFNKLKSADEIPEERINEIRKALTELSNRRKELLEKRKKITSQNEDFAPIEKQIEELSSKIADLQDERKKLADQLATLDKNSDEYKKISDKINELDGKINSMKQRLAILVNNLGKGPTKGSTEDGLPPELFTSEEEFKKQHPELYKEDDKGKAIVRQSDYLNVVFINGERIIPGFDNVKVLPNEKFHGPVIPPVPLNKKGEPKKFTAKVFDGWVDARTGKIVDIERDGVTSDTTLVARYKFDKKKAIAVGLGAAVGGLAFVSDLAIPSPVPIVSTVGTLGFNIGRGIQGKKLCNLQNDIALEASEITASVPIPEELQAKVDQLRRGKYFRTFLASAATACTISTVIHGVNNYRNAHLNRTNPVNQTNTNTNINAQPNQPVQPSQPSQTVQQPTQISPSQQIPTQPQPTTTTTNEVFGTYHEGGMVYKSPADALSGTNGLHPYLPSYAGQETFEVYNSLTGARAFVQPGQSINDIMSMIGATDPSTVAVNVMNSQGVPLTWVPLEELVETSVTLVP